jgi:hypothetical protein
MVFAASRELLAERSAGRPNSRPAPTFEEARRSTLASMIDQQIDRPPLSSERCRERHWTLPKANSLASAGFSQRNRPASGANGCFAAARGLFVHPQRHFDQTSLSQRRRLRDHTKVCFQEANGFSLRKRHGVMVRPTYRVPIRVSNCNTFQAKKAGGTRHKLFHVVRQFRASKRLPRRRASQCATSCLARQVS